MADQLQLAPRGAIAPWLVAIALAAITGVSAPRVAGAQAKLHPPPPARADGQLVLTNTGSDSVRVEVRVGDQAGCAKLPVGRTHVLAPGLSWSVMANEAICWRSAPKSQPAATWGPWQRQVVPAGATQQASP